MTVVGAFVGVLVGALVGALRTTPLSRTIGVVSTTTDDFLGNRDVARRLSRALAGERAPHAFLLWGPEQVGKRTLALRCITTVLGAPSSDAVHAHPDFLLITTAESDEGKRRVLTIAQARTARRFLATTPMLAKRKAVLIDGVEFLTIEAANALLKSLEEPPGNAVFLLIAHDLSRAPLTIRSRALPVRFTLVSDDDLADGLRRRGVPAERIGEIVRLSDGRPGRSLTFLEDAAEFRRFQRQRVLITKLFDASPFHRLAGIVEIEREGSDGLRAAPATWLPEVRKTMVAQRDRRAARLAHRLFRADALMSRTNAAPVLVLENTLRDFSGLEFRA